MNVVRDDPWSGSPDALPYSASMPFQLPNVLRGALRDAYVSVLSEQIPVELARCLARLDQRTTAQVSGLASGKLLRS